MGRRILNLLFLAMVAASLPADAVGEACPTSFLVDHSHPICLSQIPHSQSAEEAKAVWVVKTPFLSAELEEVIEIIARERVYRAMMARFGRRLPAPATAGDM